jgi:BolA protein
MGCETIAAIRSGGSAPLQGRQVRHSSDATRSGRTETGVVGMSVEARIVEKLTGAFAPDELEIVNESHLHHGHHGSPGTGESHFRVRIRAGAFAGKSRIERHRLVNEAVAELLAGPIHAFAVKALAPGEAG